VVFLAPLSPLEPGEVVAPEPLRRAPSAGSLGELEDAREGVRQRYDPAVSRVLHLRRRSEHGRSASGVGRARSAPGGGARSGPAGPRESYAIVRLPAHQAWEAAPCRAPRSRGRTTPACGWSGSLRAGSSMGAALRWPARSAVTSVGARHAALAA